jgi:hypothetical protein
MALMHKHLWNERSHEDGLDILLRDSSLNSGLVDCLGKHLTKSDSLELAELRLSATNNVRSLERHVLVSGACVKRVDRRKTVYKGYRFCREAGMYAWQLI